MFGVMAASNPSLQRTALSRAFQEAFRVCGRFGDCRTRHISRAAAELHTVRARGAK